MAEIIGETLVKRLIAWGVHRVYESPGDGLRGLLEGLRRHRDEIEPVLVDDESVAARWACAHARESGELGVCLTSGGPGGFRLRNGLYDAMLKRTPVLAITGVPEPPGCDGTVERTCHPEQNLDPLFANAFPGCSFIVTASAQVPRPLTW
jgi:pyruvate dehydrogenase (quinone)